MAGAAVLLVGSLLLASVPQSATAQAATVGGYTDIPVTTDATELLVAALGDESNYAVGVADRVCVHAVTALSEQVVAGVNYRFEVVGSAVETAEAAGWCVEDAYGAASRYQVTVFEQAWLDTVEVTAIERLGLADGAWSSSNDSESGSGSWGYGDAGYSSSSFDSSSSASYSSSGSGINAGDVGYMGDDDESGSASESTDNKTISYIGV